MSSWWDEGRFEDEDSRYAVKNYLIDLRRNWTFPHKIFKRLPNIALAAIWSSINSSTMANRLRTATINRDTNETKIQLSLSLDGGPLEAGAEAKLNDDARMHASQSSKSQQIEIDSGIGFLDHMLHALAKHAGWSLRLRCRGDLHSTFWQFGDAIFRNLLTPPSLQLTTTILLKTHLLRLAKRSSLHSGPPQASPALATHTLHSTKPSPVLSLTSPIVHTPSSTWPWKEKRSAISALRWFHTACRALPRALAWHCMLIIFAGRMIITKLKVHLRRWRWRLRWRRAELRARREKLRAPRVFCTDAIWGEIGPGIKDFVFCIGYN